MLAEIAPQLSLVIPAFEEARRLPACLEQVAEFCRLLTVSFEVLVVVERSNDGTLQIAEEAAAQQVNFRAIDNRVHRGKGFAVRSGMLQARGDVIFYMDVDLSVPLEEVRLFLDYFAQHPEVAVLIGNRRHARSNIVKQQSFVRRELGRTFNRVIRKLLGIRLEDTQCGFKAFRREAAREIFSRQQIDGFAFDVEVLLLAARLGYKMADLPVRWTNSIDSKVNFLRDGLQMLRDALAARSMVERAMVENPARVQV